MTICPNKILEDIEKTGFPTELRISSQLYKCKWKVYQNLYYFDKDESKGRELDILSNRSFISNYGDPICSVHVKMIIEVKKSKSKPWIFFTTPTDRSGNTEGYGGLDVAGYSILHWKQNISFKLLSATDIDSLKPGSNSLRIGRSFVTAFSNGDTSQIRGALISATKAAIHAQEDPVHHEGQTTSSSDIVFFVPVVVVDAEIFECYLNNNDLMLESVEYLPVKQEYLSQHYKENTYQIDVVKMSYFPKYLELQEKWMRSVYAKLTKNFCVSD